MDYATANRTGLHALAAQMMQSHPSFDVGPGRWFGPQQAAGYSPPVQGPIPVQPQGSPPVGGLGHFLMRHPQLVDQLPGGLAGLMVSRR